MEKFFGDATETVMGCTNIIKNAVGIVGIVIVLGICIIPMIKLIAFMAIYSLGAAICEPIADQKISKLLENIGSTFKLFFAIIASISIMLIIGITIIIRISGIG